jgi:hypothetical protein
VSFRCSEVVPTGWEPVGAARVSDGDADADADAAGVASVKVNAVTAMRIVVVFIR